MEKAKTLIQQKEAVHDQLKQLQTGDGNKKNSIVLDAVSSTSSSKIRHRSGPKQQQRSIKDKQKQQGGASNTSNQTDHERQPCKHW